MKRLAGRMPARAALAVGLLVAACLPAGAQSPTRRPEPVRWGHGTHAFRLVLNNLGFHPVPWQQETFDEPERTVLIFLGETDSLDRIPGGLTAFLQDGGAVLVATDRKPFAETQRTAQWERELNIEVDGAPVRLLDTASRHAYKGLDECPLIKPDDRSAHRIFQGLRHGVATNRPTCLRRGTSGERSILASFPSGCYRDQGDPFARVRFLLLFAAGGELGRGRALVLADHSVFINDMMLQEDNDNIPFAYNCLTWLREGIVKRDRALLLEEGVVVSKFDVPVVEPPLPPPGPWLNDLLQDLEDEDLFNQVIHDNVRPDHLLRAVILVLTGGLMLYGMARLVRTRHRVESGVLPLAAAVSQRGSARPVLQQRHQDMLRSGNLQEAARTLARQCFERAGVPRPHPSRDGSLPPWVTVSGSWWQRRRLRARVRRLWRLAYAPSPVRVTAPEFTRLAAEIEQIKAALAAGKVVIG